MQMPRLSTRPLDARRPRLPLQRDGTVQSKSAQGRVADAPSGHWVYRAAAARAVALCAAGALGPADRLAAAAVAVLVVGGAGGERLCAAGRPLRLAAAVALASRCCSSSARSPCAAPAAPTTTSSTQSIDAQVERTRSRPLPSGQVTPAPGLDLPGAAGAGRAGRAAAVQQFRDPARHRLAGGRRHLSVHEAIHQLAATRARPRLLLGRADGLGGRVRRPRSRRRCCSISARCSG